MQTRIDDLDVSYTIEGSGPPLVLVHGAGADVIGWEEMMPLLTPHFTVYAYDLRGFGETVRPAEPRLSLGVWTDDLLKFLDVMQLDAPIIAGWSLGGCITLNFACEHPHRASVVIPIGCRGPVPVPRDMSGFERRKQLAERGATPEEIIAETFEFTRAAFSRWSREEHPHGVQRIRDMLVRNSGDDYAEMVDAIDGASDFGPKLPRLTARAFIICGTEDGRTPPSMSEALHAAMLGSTLAMLPDCGHYYPYEKPAETSQLVIDFLHATA